MGATKILNALPGEELIGIEPPLLDQGSAGWLERLSLFAGRTLTQTALDNEQAYRGGRFTLLGQAVTQGVVQGLDLSVDLTVADPALTVAPGYGISACGQDVTLLRTMKTTLRSLAVINGTTGAYQSDFSKFTPPAGQPWAGILLLQAITADVPGSAVDSGSGPIVVSGNLGASCDQDPSEFAFEDLQIVDGARLVFALWPDSLTMPAATPLSNWRNRLAYTVFKAELGLAPDDRLPWEFLGVPLALLGFDATSKPLFADRASVVRTGGLARRRYVVPFQSGPQSLVAVQPALANARVSQFAEQLGEDLNPASPTGLVASEFALLPPCGVLPVYPSTMDFVKKEAVWCPSGWQVTAAPVYTEELEGVLRSAITAAPLDTAQNETIEILVPLPDEVYDPNVLMTEVVAAVFQQEVDAATIVRNRVLLHRETIELEANALASVVNQPQIDTNAGLTADETAVIKAGPPWVPAAGETFATSSVSGSFVSTDLQQLQSAAASSPYAIQVNTFTYNAGIAFVPGNLVVFNGNTWLALAASTNVTPGSNAADWVVTTPAGLFSATKAYPPGSVVTYLNNTYVARQQTTGVTPGSSVSIWQLTQVGLFSPDDWNDLQTNGLQHFIQRIQNKLDKANDLLDLAFLTSQTDIYRYRQSVLGTSDATRLAVSPILANIASGVTAAATASNIQQYLASIQSVIPPATTTTPRPGAVPAAVKAPTLQKTVSSVSAALNVGRIDGAVAPPAPKLSVASARPLSAFVPVTVGTAANPASPTDITQQVPVIGTQASNLLNLRTLTIAERLAPSPPQEALSYSVGNRVSILQLLAALEITVDDIPILADNIPAGLFPPLTMADLRSVSDPNRSGLAFSLVNNPAVPPNSDESAIFSIGIQVLEQHTQMLRAVEERIQLYNDFLALCTKSLGNVQTNLQSARTLLTQLGNDLTQARQNLAFVTTLLADETARVASVNQTRANTLQTYVQFIAFARPRTVVGKPGVQSRQLVPTAVSNPVPACLKQTLSIPPELREMVALLREAPVTWFPPIRLQLGNLERPDLLQSLAVSTQARANLQLSLPLHVSSAAYTHGVFAPAISRSYSANQLVLRNYQTQRVAFQPLSLTSLSWSSQVATLSSVVAVADLQASEAVHAEIVAAAARAMQQISSVATCLYTRVGLALPIDRLTWAQFIQANPGVSLQSLAILPGWDSVDYTDRQQMQLLVDWLFQQIDATDPAAPALMNDVVAVAILLASDAPADGIIAGAVAIRTTPVIGHPIRLTLPSTRVAHGMYVDLYNAGALTARAVVSDLDAAGVTATFTDVYKPNVSLEANDVAHFTALDPNAVVYKAFS